MSEVQIRRCRPCPCARGLFIRLVIIDTRSYDRLASCHRKALTRDYWVKGRLRTGICGAPPNLLFYRCLFLSVLTVLVILSCECLTSSLPSTRSILPHKDKRPDCGVPFWLPTHDAVTLLDDGISTSAAHREESPAESQRDRVSSCLQPDKGCGLIYADSLRLNNHSLPQPIRRMEQILLQERQIPYPAESSAAASESKFATTRKLRRTGAGGDGVSDG